MTRAGLNACRLISYSTFWATGSRATLKSQAMCFGPVVLEIAKVVRTPLAVTTQSNRKAAFSTTSFALVVLQATVVVGSTTPADAQTIRSTP